MRVEVALRDEADGQGRSIEIASRNITVLVGKARELEGDSAYGLTWNLFVLKLHLMLSI